MIKQETFVADVRRFTEAVGCTTDRFNVRQTALYIGLQLEEMAEKLEAVGMVGEEGSIPRSFRSLSEFFKAGFYDSMVANGDQEAMLDADVDLAWVTIGSSLSQGADVLGAMREVARANIDKLIPCDEQHLGIDRPLNDCPKCGGTLYYVIKDENGKVKKPDGWRGPDNSPFIIKRKTGLAATANFPHDDMGAEVAA